MAHVLLRTLRVGGAFGWWKDAFAQHSRVSGEVRNAGADAVVVHWLAQCILTTCTKQITRILAKFVDARLLKATVGIVSTSIYD